MDDLIERLEAAESGSRELDALLWAHFHAENIKVLDWIEPYGGLAKTQVEFTVPPKRSAWVTSDRGPYRHAEPVSTSLDAALALAERVLGHTEMQIRIDQSGPASVAIEHGFASHVAVGLSPALVLCAAILKANQHDH